MAVDARTEEFQHIELFDKFALFTNARIDRTTVPEGWYCYDFRGTGDDPGEEYFSESGREAIEFACSLWRIDIDEYLKETTDEEITLT